MNRKSEASPKDISINISRKSFASCKTSENSNKKNTPPVLLKNKKNNIVKKQRVFSFENLLNGCFTKKNSKIKKRRRRKSVKKKKYDVNKNLIKIKFLYLFKKTAFKCENSSKDLRSKIFDILKQNEN